MAEPCLWLLRRFIPIVGGVDWSLLIAIVVLYLISSFVILPLKG
ncbi:MAG: YggT family protein [Gammaproteobacteria bacterium]|nr:YggT family protein [Gammaproteobacteria bacterium]